MTITELRIGNYVCVGAPDNYFKIDSATSLLALEKDIDKAMGVPITEEWLVKFWFIKNCIGSGVVEHELFIDADYNATLLSSEPGIVCLRDCDGGMIGKTMEYVHQLQNLYFALTREEIGDPMTGDADVIITKPVC